MEQKYKNLLVETLLLIDKKGVPLFKIPNFQPNKKTIKTLQTLYNIYHKCEHLHLKTWIAGSWAVAGIYGDFIKNTSDIDITVETEKDEQKLTEILIASGFECKGTSPLGAINFVNKETEVQIDIGSIENSTTAFKNVVLHSNDYGNIRDFRFRILPKNELLNVYKQIVFVKGRSVKEDLIKLKVLSSKN